jgi:hypothetical protein
MRSALGPNLKHHPLDLPQTLSQSLKLLPMSVIQTKPLTTRDPGPYPAERRCQECGCFLSRYNPLELCNPCFPSAEMVSDRAVFQERREVLEELMAA